MVLSERTLDALPSHVKTATRHWLLDGSTKLYHPRGDAKVFGKTVQPCTLVELIARHGSVEIVEE